MQILLKRKYYHLYTCRKALKMCWRHQNFQMSTTTHQTTVPSTHPKIQTPKSSGQSTWPSHLRASHLRAYILHSLKLKVEMKHLWLFFKFCNLTPLSQNIMFMIVWKNSFFALVSIKIFKIYFFALFQVETFLW